MVTLDPKLLSEVDYIFAVTFALGSRCIVSEPSPDFRGSAADYPRFHVRASSNSPAVSAAVSRGSCDSSMNFSVTIGTKERALI